MKIVSTVSLVLTEFETVSGHDIIEFADELKTRKAENDRIGLSFHTEYADRGGVNKTTVTLSHKIDGRDDK